MSKVNAIVLRAAGVNCNDETEYALRLAGAEAVEQIHVNRLIEQPAELGRFNFMVVPGGFSYGDDISAGKILARQLIGRLGEPMGRFIESGKLVLGICNGFQVLIKAGLLPGVEPTDVGANGDAGRAGLVTLTDNDSGRYEDRWVHLLPASNHNVFLPASDQPIYLPVAHGEGKLAVASPAVLAGLHRLDLVAVRYATQAGTPAGRRFPLNPNGSIDDIAGLCDRTGRVFGLMPHPERHVLRTQHPQWTRLPASATAADGLQIFVNGVQFLRKN